MKDGELGRVYANGETIFKEGDASDALQANDSEAIHVELYGTRNLTVQMASLTGNHCLI